ncbi:hypothetical protein [Lacticaseibacillus saniviri]
MFPDLNFIDYMYAGNIYNDADLDFYASLGTITATQAQGLKDKYHPAPVAPVPDVNIQSASASAANSTSASSTATSQEMSESISQTLV